MAEATLDMPSRAKTSAWLYFSVGVFSMGAIFWGYFNPTPDHLKSTDKTQL